MRSDEGTSRCGVTVELVPWGDGKNQLTTSYRWFLASWAKRLSWSEVGSIFRTSWDSVCRAVEHAVEWGLAHRDLGGVTALGIDEVAWQRGHTYMTLVYDKVIREELGHAVHVLDRFHVMRQFGKALDEIRAEEAKKLVKDGYEPVLKRSRWCLLKRPEKQTVKLKELLKYNLRTMRAYLRREDFQRFWEYKSAA